ncbi:MAG: capsid protein [Ethanoligenens sp.]
MGWMLGVQNAVSTIRQRILSVLRFQPAGAFSVTIYEPYSYAANVARNRIWYRGEPSELFQFYKSNGASSTGDSVNRSRFWAAVPSRGMQIRKIHTGLPALCVDKLADIVVTDMQSVVFSGPDAEKTQTRWNRIAAENDLTELVRRAVVETDVTGDGAFKISFDTSISPLPLLEFYSGEQVAYTTVRGRITEITFYTPKELDGQCYQLAETYASGSVRYALCDRLGRPADLSLFDDLTNLSSVSWAEPVLWAVPLAFAHSPTFTGRGRSLFDGKCDVFDALDEDISQWTDAVRAGRASRYIPIDLIPRDTMTGAPMEPNPFDNQFIAVRGALAEAQNGQVQVVQPDIRSDAYQQKYTADLDIALMGVLSPSTLGIGLSKKDNAEAQREKEKATLYSRAKRVAALERVLPKLAQATLAAEDILSGRPVGDYPCTISWGEYANPSFESVAATVGQARQNGIMSIEQAVRELYGDTMSAPEKQVEVARIKMEQGLFPGNEQPA